MQDCGRVPRAPAKASHEKREKRVPPATKGETPSLDTLKSLAADTNVTVYTNVDYGGGDDDDAAASIDVVSFADGFDAYGERPGEAGERAARESVNGSAGGFETNERRHGGELFDVDVRRGEEYGEPTSAAVTGSSAVSAGGEFIAKCVELPS